MRSRVIMVAALLTAGSVATLATGAAAAPVDAVHLADGHFRIPGSMSVFFDRSFGVVYPAGRVMLSSTPDGTGQISVDDKMYVDVTRPSGSTAGTYVHDFSNGCQGRITPTQPQDVTHLFGVGTNGLRLRFQDVCGGFNNSQSNTTFWLVIVDQPTTLVAEPVVADVLPGATVFVPELRARLTESAGGAPIAGRRVRFSVEGIEQAEDLLGPTELCVAETDADGWAICNDLVMSARSALSLGYRGAFDGDRYFRAAAASAPLVRVNGTPLP